MTDVPLWVTVLLPLVGYMAAVGTEVLRNHLQASREINQRIVQRNEARQDRRDEFELAVLNDTYAALSRQARAAMRFHLADLKVAKSLGVKYAADPITEYAGPDLDEELRLASVALRTHIQLLLDDEIRRRVTSALDALVRPSAMHNSEIEDAEQAMSEAVLNVERAQELCGQRIRELYAAGAAN